MTITEEIMKLLAGPRGMSSSDLSQYTVKQVGQTLQKLCAKGLAFSVKIAHKNVRYFGTQEHAEAFKRGLPALPPRRAPVRTKKPDAAVEVITPENVLRTIERAPPPRFQTVPLLTDKPQPIRSGAYDFRQHQRPGRF